MTDMYTAGQTKHCSSAVSFIFFLMLSGMPGRATLQRCLLDSVFYFSKLFSCVCMVLFLFLALASVIYNFDPSVFPGTWEGSHHSYLTGIRMWRSSLNQKSNTNLSCCQFREESP